MMRIWRLSVWRMSLCCVHLAENGEAQEDQNWHTCSPHHTWIGHHFQDPKVKGQLARDGNIVADSRYINSIIFMVPTTIGVRDGLQLGRSIRRGHIVSPRAQLVIPQSPPLIGRAIKRWCCLSDVCLSDVCLSIAYIRPKSRTERPRKTKIGRKVAHVTRNSDTTFRSKGQRLRSPGRFAHRGLNAWGRCSGDRENVLGVGNYCSVAREALGRPRGRRGAGVYRVVIIIFLLLSVACLFDVLCRLLEKFTESVMVLVCAFTSFTKSATTLRNAAQSFSESLVNIVSVTSHSGTVCLRNNLRCKL